jgi:GAF domain
VLEEAAAEGPVPLGLPGQSRSWERPGWPLFELARRIQTVVECDGAGVIEVSAGRACAAASTTGVAGELDQIQCDAGEGPSLDAIRQLQLMSIDEVERARWWPAFRHAALDRAVLSALSVPLTSGSDVLGALSFYSSRLGAFSSCEELVLRLAGAAGATSDIPHASKSPRATSTSAPLLLDGEHKAGSGRHAHARTPRSNRSAMPLDEGTKN